jgi:hypothetical protein
MKNRENDIRGSVRGDTLNRILEKYNANAFSSVAREIQRESLFDGIFRRSTTSGFINMYEIYFSSNKTYIITFFGFRFSNIQIFLFY